MDQHFSHIQSDISTKIQLKLVEENSAHDLVSSPSIESNSIETILIRLKISTFLRPKLSIAKKKKKRKR